MTGDMQLKERVYFSILFYNKITTYMHTQNAKTSDVLSDSYIPPDGQNVHIY